MDLEDVRLAVYGSFHRSGRAPTTGELVAQLGVDEATVREALGALSARRHVVLDGAGAIVMAHPFSARPLGFSVMGRDTLWWGGCCWDSFAMPHLLPDEDHVLVATTCPGCGQAGAWVVTTEAPPVDTWVAHFLVPVARMWDDVVHTCAHQRLFCSAGCVDAWCAAAGRERGFLMDLDTLWRLASHWYDGRLDRGYTRRDPAASTDYLREIGLVDPFWGTA
jgi:hypothetical protein